MCIYIYNKKTTITYNITINFDELLGSNVSDPFPFEAENLFCTFFTFEWLVRLLRWPHWGCGWSRWSFFFRKVVKGWCAIGCMFLSIRCRLRQGIHPFKSFKRWMNEKTSQKVCQTSWFHTFHLSNSPLTRLQALYHLRFAFQRKVLALTDAWPLWWQMMAGSRTVEWMCSFSDGADLFGDLLTMFITNTPWAWANQWFFKSLKVLKIYRNLSIQIFLGDGRHGRRIWPEVCIRHALGVLNDRGDLDYDTWMRLELVLEDQTLGKIYRKRSFWYC